MKQWLKVSNSESHCIEEICGLPYAFLGFVPSYKKTSKLGRAQTRSQSCGGDLVLGLSLRREHLHLHLQSTAQSTQGLQKHSAHTLALVQNQEEHQLKLCQHKIITDKT